MADDIVDLLRMPISGLYDDETGDEIPCSYCVKAADEIERLREDRDRWKRLFIRGYESDATSDDMMHAYRKEKW